MEEKLYLINTGDRDYFLESRTNNIGNEKLRSVSVIGSLNPTLLEHKLSLKNCQAIENSYDLDELAEKNTSDCDASGCYPEDYFKIGFQKALEILGDKKFSEEDVMQLVKSSFYAGLSKGQGKNQDFNIDDYVKEHLQQNGWGVEIVMEDVFVHSPSLSPNQKSQWEKKPKLDADGCLILRRI